MRSVPSSTCPTRTAICGWKCGPSIPADPSRDILLDYSDSRVDNVEHIWFTTLADYTQYKLVVSYSNLAGQMPGPASERYALAWTVEEKSREQNILWYDLNGDGIVDEQDLAILMANQLAGQVSSQVYLIGDINGDGMIDERDVQELVQRYNLTADWYASNVSEVIGPALRSLGRGP